MEKTTKKRVTIAAVIIAVICLAGVGVYFAAPYIKNVTDPGSKAIHAMKNTNAEMADYIKGSIDSTIKGITEGETRTYTGYITYDDVTYKSDNLLDYLKTNTIKYNYGIDMKADAIGGRISLAAGEADTDAASLDFYIDSRTLYFKVPQLSSYNFKMSLDDALEAVDNAASKGKAASRFDIGFDKGDIDYALKLLDSVDKEEGDSYCKAIQSVIDDIQKGMDKAAEELIYSKTGSREYESGSYKQNTTCYNVTVTKEALLDGADAAIEAIYDDDSISGYRTLITSYYKNSREKLKEAARKYLEDYENFDMTIYVGEGNRVVAYEMEQNDNSGNGKMLVESFLKGQITYLSANMSYDGSSVISDTQRVDDNTYKVTAQINSDDVKASYHGEAGLSDNNKLIVSAADFTNALDVTQLSNRQYQAIALEAMSNINVINQIISTDRWGITNENTGSR